MRLARSARIARFLVLATVLAAAIVPARAAGDALYAVEIATAGPAVLQTVTGDAGVRWWAELGDVLVVLGTGDSRARAARVAPTRELERPSGGERYYVTRLVHPNEISRPTHNELRVLVSSGIYALVAATPAGASELGEHGHGQIAELRADTVYARASANDAAAEVLSAKPALRAPAAAVDVERWHGTVADLANFGTRYVGTPGALAARDYIAAEFERLGLETTVETFTAAGSPAYNVVAEIGGDLRSDEIYIVCGHYDSISERPESLAPGAEDNGSGAAGVVELARVFAEHPPAATIRFVAFSGEEVGLVGSRRYVDALERSGEAGLVKGVINMDMIAYSSDADLDVLLETSQIGVPLADALADAAASTDLRVVRSLNPFGSDHVPFLHNGIPCVLTIENDWDEYNDYHTSRDTIANVRRDMGGEVLKMNAGALAALAGDGNAGASVSLSNPAGREVVYAGFVETFHWASGGDQIANFALELSTDGGATFVPIATGIDREALRYDWSVPSGLVADDARLRIVAATNAGLKVTDTADGRLEIRPSGGPTIKKVKFKRDKLVVTGRLPGEYAKIVVDDVELETTYLIGRVDGNTTKRLFGVDSRIETLVPRGVAVRIRVVDTRTGLSTSEVTFTR
jgi:hypothetical protein